MPELFASLSNSAAVSLKVGGSACNLLRPDKLVVYFDRKDDLHDFAEQLFARTAGIPAQGVPFSFPIDSDGLLSWGLDPLSASEEATAEQMSWRWSLCQQVALAMVDRSPPYIAMEPWQRAIAWLRGFSIDARHCVWRFPAGEQAPSKAG
ncbi:hypothetical protein [Paraburkholderia sp. CI3]|uniref:hypothetical protein n=1 Tax=Paraburkholderia sp. CI3 TaxID=2991060 RepID=UPI003D238236